MYIRRLVTQKLYHRSKGNGKDVETYNGGVVSEQFLDRNGRTVLWRRYERGNGDGEKITVNGTTFTHTFDCITDYIL